MPDPNGASVSRHSRIRSRGFRSRGLGIAAGLATLLAVPDPAQAIAPRAGQAQTRTKVDLAPGVAALRPTRVHDGRTPRLRVAARQALESELGTDLIVSFDRDTGVADWLLPTHALVPGANASPAIAEQFASGFIARHIDALAPGASASDFVLVSDETSHGLRTLGFVQHSQSREVIGGQLSVSFRADQLVAVRSQALPHVQLPPLGLGQSLVSSSRAELEARAWISTSFADGDPARAQLSRPPSANLSILPLIHADGSVEYREVFEADVRLDLGGHWRVWVDARTGQPVARRDLQSYAQVDIVSFRRHLYGDRVSFPAASLDVEVNGQTQVTNASGFVDADNASVYFRAQGPFVGMVNQNGSLAEVDTMFGPNAQYVWDLADDPEADAQLSAFVHTNIVKQRIREIDPGFGVPDMKTQVSVNISDVCNAFAEDNTINFFLEGGGCNNSALIADVVYHEFGHVAHYLGLQPGVGIFDGAVSEGASDYLSATIVDSPQVGVGFFADTLDPIRDLDPPGSEWKWPEDIGEVHDEGRILGGTLWDLRELLIAKYGEELGVLKTDQIWLGGLQRSVDMPSWYVEALITNDDDGNLQNGTPDACEIDQAFGVHGLAQPVGALVDVNELIQPDGSVVIEVAFDEGVSPCPGVVTAEATLAHRPRPQQGDPTPLATFVDMVETAPGTLRAVIPPPAEYSVTQYRLDFDWGNGTLIKRPDNRADQWYELWTGPLTEIWCAEFEDGGAGWTYDGDWDIGQPQGFGGDPDEAWSGAGVAGTRLQTPGTYNTWTTSTLTSPSIDVSEYEAVRLQYRRWLNIEDGYWDQAWVLANGQVAWQNFAGDFEWYATTHHRDREWRFHDVELTPYVDAGSVTLDFVQSSDGGLEFGGWTVDEVCVVGHGAPESEGGGCGDGVLQQYEQCDDGNLQNGDGCSSGCLFEDEDEPEPEPEPELGWDPGGRGCGCAVEDDDDQPGRSAGTIALLALVGLGLRRRRDRVS